MVRNSMVQKQQLPDNHLRTKPANCGWTHSHAGLHGVNTAASGLSCKRIEVAWIVNRSTCSFFYMMLQSLLCFALNRGRLMADSNRSRFQSCFSNWIAQQHQDLEELLSGLSTDSETDNEKLKLLVEKSIKNFEEYSDKRALLVHHDAPSFISPSWCSPFENALLWIGGCRPSLSVRLVYSVGGLELDDHLSAYLLPERKDNLAEISERQLQMIDTLHCKTIREEDKLTSRMATLQESIADLPVRRGEAVGESSVEVEHAMDDEHNEGADRRSYAAAERRPTRRHQEAPPLPP